MKSLVVSDSGILIASVMREPLTGHAQGLLRHWRENTVQINAPYLLQYEIIAALRKNAYRRLITDSEAADMRDTLLKIPVRLFFDADLLRRAYELAEQLNRPTAYDAQYLAVAERLECDFWTADEKLYNASAGQLAFVRWLGHFTRSDNP
jgi:predicted nucleic acid-binding protein